MTMIVKTNSHFPKIRALLKENSIRHSVEIGTTSARINVDNTKYIFTDTPLSIKELSFVRKVKNCVLKRGVQPLLVKSGDILYIKYSPNLNQKYRDIVEIDVNKAYWRIAYILGYINTEIYKEGLSDAISKSARLVALGSLATKRDVFNYEVETGVYKKGEVIVNEYLRSVFLHICFELGRIMDETDNKDYLFFWVDAFFTIKEKEQHIKDRLINHGLECKTKEIYLFYQRGSKYFVYTKDAYDQETKSTPLKIRPFYNPNQNEARKKMNQIIKDQISKI